MLIFSAFRREYTALRYVNFPPKRHCLLTSQGTELYLCGRKQTLPPAPPQGRGVDSAAELDAPPPIVEAGATIEGKQDRGQPKVLTLTFNLES